ncbi:MAG: hypothetical protein AB1423_01885 [Pseudomonadota bacterium]
MLLKEINRVCLNEYIAECRGGGLERLSQDGWPDDPFLCNSRGDDDSGALRTAGISVLADRGKRSGGEEPLAGAMLC